MQPVTTLQPKAHELVGLARLCSGRSALRRGLELPVGREESPEIHCRRTRTMEPLLETREQRPRLRVRGELLERRGGVDLLEVEPPPPVRDEHALELRAP